MPTPAFAGQGLAHCMPVNGDWSYDSWLGAAAMRGVMKSVFNRQTLSELIVLWFAVWILWWFRRWVGHGPMYFPDLTAPEAREFYEVEMRTLVRSLLQSFVISSLALLAWRILRRHPAAGDAGPRPGASR